MHLRVPLPPPRGQTDAAVTTEVLDVLRSVNHVRNPREEQRREEQHGGVLATKRLPVSFIFSQT